jgi:hypothetical protein
VSIAAASLPGPAGRHALSLRAGHDLIGLLLTLLALVVAGKLAIPRELPPPIELPPAACDLQRQDCRLALPGGGAIELRLPERPVAPNRAFVVEGRSEGKNVRLLSLSLQGVELGMDGTPATFVPEADGTYRARTGIPLCTVSRMTWRMRVRLGVDGQSYEWPLLFRTEGGSGQSRMS